MAGRVARARIPHEPSEIEEKIEAYWAEKVARYCCNADGTLRYDDDTVAFLGLLGVKVLAYRAEVMGDAKAAMWLAEKGLGAPEQPFNAVVANLAPQESRRMLYAVARELGLSETTAGGLVRLAERRDFPALIEATP
jgi:hypothetical protein